MMKEIMIINPRSKARKSSHKKGAVKMAKKRSRKRAAPKKHRKYRRNPSKVRRYAKAAGGRLLGGLNFKSALKSVLAMNVGMFAAKFGAKRFGIDSTETDPDSWTWRSYLQASIGATLAAMLANMAKRGSGQKVLEGGLGYVLFKAVENELISKNETATKWFGAGEDIPEGEMVLDLDGTPGMMLGGQMYPLDERHRMMGDSLVPVGRLGGLGDTLVPVGRLGQSGNPSLTNLLHAYDTEYH